MIYLASPYSSNSPEVRQDRYVAVCAYAARLFAEGHHVYSPIAHTHGIALYGGLKGDWDFWEKFDRAMISRCDRMMVLKLPGWEQSKGIQAEVVIAGEFGILVEYVDP